MSYFARFAFGFTNTVIIIGVKGLGQLKLNNWLEIQKFQILNTDIFPNYGTYKICLFSRFKDVAQYFITFLRH